MAHAQANGEKGEANPLGFMPTHWSVVLAVGHANPARRAQALEQLCRSYWEPLYAYNRLGMTDAALRQEVHRLRRRLRKLVRAEIAQTVRDPGEIEAEMRYLIELLSR